MGFILPFLFVILVGGNVFGHLLPSETTSQALAPRSCNRSKVAIALKIPESDSLFHTLSRQVENIGKRESMKFLSTVQERSGESAKRLCPFTLRENIDDDRIPRILLTAECQAFVEDEANDKIYSCNALYYVLPVLKMDKCQHGVSLYRQEKENITIACIPEHIPNGARPSSERIPQVITSEAYGTAASEVPDATTTKIEGGSTPQIPDATHSVVTTQIPEKLSEIVGDLGTF